eukprot:TRINITY_DN28860_c1_g2_i1.p1 TRINITY_DN28860_c1_g2~~TRINITY_DN28860_c1_g2_i1.p1  ORF type:complete len:581 (-),score=27.78 TRINITY_DN28860_c1_g2_i1:256-1998(-)
MAITFYTFVANAAFSTYYMSLLIYLIKSIQAMRFNLTQPRATCKRIWEGLACAICHGRRELDAFEVKVFSKLAERRIARAVSAYRVVSVFVLTLFVLWSLLTENEFPYTEDRFAKRQLLSGAHIEALPLVVLGLVSQFYPTFVTTFVLDATHLCLAMKICFHQLETLSAAMHLYENMTVYRLLLAVTLGNSKFTMFLNVAMSISSVIGYWNAPGIVDMDNYLVSGHQYGVIWRELYGCMVISFTAREIEKWTITEIRSSLKLGVSTQAESTIRTILRATCDAVLYLSSSLHLISPSPQLAAILLKCGGENALLGTCLTDLLFSNEDETLLNQHMPAGNAPVRAKTDQLAPVVQLAFKDSVGARVLCELFYASFTGIDEQRCYVLGLRELGEGREMPPTSLSLDTRVVESTRAAKSNASSRARGSASESKSSSSSSSSNENSAMHLEDNPEIAITVDAMSADFDIMSCTEGFLRLGGPSSSGLPFLRWLSGSDKPKFLQHMQVLLQRWDAEERRPGVWLGSFNVRMHPPGLKKLMYYTKGTVFGGQDEDSLSLVFREVKLRTGRTAENLASSPASSCRLKL